MQIIAGGFPNRYGGVSNEFRLSRKDPSEWFPTSDDFRATARLSGGGTGEATNFKQLLEMIGKQSKGSIEVLDLVGHAGNISLTIGDTTFSDGSGFALGGLIHGTRWILPLVQ